MSVTAKLYRSRPNNVITKINGNDTSHTTGKSTIHRSNENKNSSTTPRTPSMTAYNMDWLTHEILHLIIDSRTRRSRIRYHFTVAVQLHVQSAGWLAGRALP